MANNTFEEILDELRLIRELLEKHFDKKPTDGISRTTRVSKPKLPAADH